MLHNDSAGFVELTPGTRPPDDKVQVNRRHRPEHFLPAGQENWLRRALYHADRIIDGAYAKQQFADGPREEVFVGVAPRTERKAGNQYVAETRWLWTDIDEPNKLRELWAFLRDRPCHLLVESGGSGGQHAYWALDRPLPATRVDTQAGELTEPIEQANGRLIRRVDGDKACRNRDRVMRLAGSINWKTGNHARIIQADLVAPPYSLAELVGDLPDLEPTRTHHAGQVARTISDDPYRQIPAAVYMARIAGLQVDGAGFVSCPSPRHNDTHPSCHVCGPDPTLWKCFSCPEGSGGTIYDLASLTLGGPTGPELRGEAFLKARQLVVDTFGDPKPRRPSSPTARERR